MAKLHPRSTFILFFVVLMPALAYAQSFQAGLKSYKQHDFEQATKIFSSLNTPQSTLFTAKSYYALQQFDKAEDILNGLLKNAAPRIFYEAAYTSALVDFHQEQYGYMLTKLYRIFKNSTDLTLAEDAQELYQQIINYLTAKQRLTVINGVKKNEIKYDLVKSALGKLDYTSLKKVINKFYETVDGGSWAQKVHDIENSISSKPAYKIEYGDEYRDFTPPQGMIYNIGITLPKFNSEKPTYGVIQGLYLGAQLATNQFNNTHSETSVHLSFLPSKADDLDKIVENFEANSGDIIIGPLFSEQAKEIVPLSTEYDIPILAPLATAQIETDGTLFYQANSNFGVHGKIMAQFAVQDLGFNTFVIIAGHETNGAVSAKAFRKKAKELGAKIVYFSIKDFGKDKQAIKKFIKRLGSKLTDIDAIYAPFTSNATPYLVEQIIYALNTLEHPITLLGSAKWSNINFSSDIYARSDIYYSVNSYRSNNLSDFQSRYRRAFNLSPNKYAVIGYDIARYILTQLAKIGNPAILSTAMQKAPFYRGLIKNIYFNGSNVNQAIQILEVNNGRSTLQPWH